MNHITSEATSITNRRNLAPKQKHHITSTPLHSQRKNIMFDIRKTIAVLTLVGSLPLMASVCYAQQQAKITFDNKSGQAAFVKLAGPTKRSVQVPDGQERLVRA